MNERILELALQSGTWEYFNAGDEKTKTMDEQSLRNFAKLIIAKCIEEAGEPGDELIKGDTWHDGVRASVWSIEEYFGVK